MISDRREVVIARVGVAALVVSFAAAALTFALQMPPFYGADESAQLAYAHEVARGRLPEIPDPIDPPADAVDWRETNVEAADREHRSVWVANHPPLFYVAVVPLVWLSNALGRADGGVMFIRFANIAFAAVGLVFTYMLAHLVTAGSRRLALSATALAALLPFGHGTFAHGMNDGLGFAAATAVTYAAVRLVSRGFQRADMVWLGAAATVGAGARAGTMFVAMVVVVVAAIVRIRRTAGSRQAQLRAASTVVAAGLVPAAALFGWFYARNAVLYGDLTGSSFLFDYFGRVPAGTTLEVLTWRRTWGTIYEGFTVRPLPLSQPRTPAIVVAASFGIAAVVGLVMHWIGPRPASRPMARSGLLIALAVLAAVVAMLATHIAGGGSAFARYLFPAHAVIAILFTLGLDRLWPKVLPVLAATVVVVWAGHFIPSRVADQISIDGYLPPVPLDTPGALLLGVTCFLASLVALLALIASGSRRKGPQTAQGRAPQRPIGVA